MHTPKFQIDSVYITGRLAEPRGGSITLTLNDYTTLYTVEPNESYYCAVVERQIEKDALVAILQDYLVGDYLLIAIQTDDLPCFSLLIDKLWLYNQLARQKTKIDSFTHLKIENWLKSNSTFYWKHTIFQSHYQREVYKLLLIQTYSLDILYRLLTDCLIETDDNTKPHYVDHDLKKVLDLGESILIDVQKPMLTIKEMSLMAGINESKFKRLFKQVFKQTPHQYILERKLKYAEELIKTGQYTLTQIAYKLGYNHTSGFTRLYNKKFER